MALARARRERGIDYWPGFVDALSTLILGIIFLLSVFVVVQFFLSQEVTGKDTALQRLNAQIAQLTEMLSLEKIGKAMLEDTARRNCARTSRPPRASATAQGPLRRPAAAAAAQGKITSSPASSTREKSISSRALAQVELLNQQIAALRRQLAALEQALEASEKQGQGIAGAASPISANGSMLRWPSACRSCRATAPTSSDGCARSSATGRTSASSATASCSSRRCSSTPAGWPRSSRRAAPSSTSWRPRCSSSRRQIPTDIAWVLRVDGHTDVRPITSAAFPVELGAVGGARDLGGAVPDQQGHLAAAPGRGRLRRIPAARSGPQRRCLSPQPPDRVEADRAVSASLG